MHKTVNAKVKICQKFSVIILNVNFHSYKNYYLFYKTFAKVKIQATTAKNSCF